MIDINLTLIIQAFNFLIAYIIIERLLLRPVVTLLEADEHKMTQAEKKLAHAQKQLANKEEYKIQQWNSFQDYFKTATPRIEHKPIEINPIERTEKKLLTEAQKDKVIDELTNILIKEVSNVH